MIYSLSETKYQVSTQVCGSLYLWYICHVPRYDKTNNVLYKNSGEKICRIKQAHNMTVEIKHWP